VKRVKSCEGADLAEIPSALCATDESGAPLSERDVPDPVAVALASFCAAADLNGDGRVDRADTALVEESLGLALHAVAVDPLPEPPSAPGCVRPGRLESAKVVLRGRGGAAAAQVLDIKGEAVLPHPFDPRLSPLVRGVHVAVVTAAGRKVLDADLPAGAGDRSGQAGWKANRAGTRWQYAGQGAVGKAFVKAFGGDRADRVALHIVAKGGDLSVSPAELPLTTRVSLDASSAATDRCAEAIFQAPPDRPACVPSSSGLVCR